MVYVHFSRPSNNAKLIEVQSKLGLKKGNVLRICDTRWVCRYKNCESMIKNYSSILEFLKNEVEAQVDKDAIEAIGILGQNTKLCFFYWRKAKSIINGSIQSIEKLRSDIEFSTFWQKITSLAEENDITLEVPHKGSLKKVYLWLAPLIIL
ncbi:unnamed protein product [Macrosiphum euphorbiae]|uniref:Uncharacterized protein n=1 Tax=Macrosiphum euphorbiae TaxID=13131 RepID=A0AAV0Y2D1_9HEMI|nr:unnamed protein product [Macrosiphum euphorbiae]